MLNIIHLIWGLGGGGKERRLIQLIKGFHAKGYEQTLISMSNRNDYKGQFEDCVEFIVIDSGSKLSRCRRLSKILKEKGPAILHLWQSTPALIFILPYLKFRFKFKYVAGYISEAQPLKWLTFKSFCNQFTFLFADAIVSNSKACLISKHADYKKSHVIFNGFDFSRFDSPSFVKTEYRTSLGLNDKQFVATMVARFTPQKDYSMLIDLAEKVKDLNNVVFLTVGKGETLEEIQRACKDRNIDNVRFLGFRSDVEKILLCSDIGLLFTNSKVHAEGISNSILESMAAGLPVIATNGGGTPEIIEDGKSGFIVKPCDFDAAASLVRKLWLDEGLRNEIGNNAKRRIEDHFSLDSMTKKYIQLYNSL